MAMEQKGGGMQEKEETSRGLMQISFAYNRGENGPEHS